MNDECGFVPPTISAAKTAKTPNTAILNDGPWISLCGGIDTLAMVATALKIKPSAYLSVEMNDKSRKIGDHASPKSASFPGIDHSWASDVMTITREKVKSMVGKYGVPRMIGAGAPCQDHTKCRLLPARFKSDLKEVKRPGFAGEKGKVFKKVVAGGD